MFKDEAVITVKAGRGGDGCVSFRREAFAPKGGPDGGAGGRGGDVTFVADRHESSLLTLMRRRNVKAAPGQPGSGANRFGKDGRDEVVLVPVGTMFFDAETGELLADLTEEGNSWRAARGGRGGKGNKFFASATHQVPREFEYGEPGESRKLKLELRMIADVGLAGLPNAGKSTLLSRCSAAKPKVASYPFTTLEPSLGIVERGFARFIMADIPGLIEGASSGKGLGHKFLRHIERTRILVHLVDLSSGDLEELVANYHTIRRELEAHSPSVASKFEVVAGNKVDVTEAREILPEFAAAIGKPVIPVSGVTGEGIEEFLTHVMRELQRVREEDRVEAEKLRQEAIARGEDPDAVPGSQKELPRKRKRVIGVIEHGSKPLPRAIREQIADEGYGDNDQEADESLGEEE